MKPATTTLDTLCKNYGVVAARCQYFGEPHPYIVDGIADAMKGSTTATWYKDLLAGALKMADSVYGLGAFEYRVILLDSSILVMEHPDLEKCYIAVLYRTGSTISKSIRRMIRRQFKNFTRDTIKVEPAEIQLGDNLLQVPTHLEGGTNEEAS